MNVCIDCKHCGGNSGDQGRDPLGVYSAGWYCNAKLYRKRAISPITGEVGFEHGPGDLRLYQPALCKERNALGECKDFELRE